MKYFPVINVLAKGSSTRFEANRPFLFFIKDNYTKMVLFAGRLVSPLRQFSRSSQHHQPLQLSQPPQTPAVENYTSIITVLKPLTYFVCVVVFFSLL